MTSVDKTIMIVFPFITREIEIINLNQLIISNLSPNYDFVKIYNNGFANQILSNALATLGRTLKAASNSLGALAGLPVFKLVQT
jgi:hypothetical protein